MKNKDGNNHCANCGASLFQNVTRTVTKPEAPNQTKIAVGISDHKIIYNLEAKKQFTKAKGEKRIKRTVSGTLLVLLFVGMFTFTFSLKQASSAGSEPLSDGSLSIPFEGLTLKYVWHNRIQIESMVTEYDEIHLIKYSKISSTIFEITSLSPDSETYEVDAITREILTGSMKGDFSTYCLDTDIAIGDVIKIKDSNAMVVSLEEKVHLSSIGSEPVVLCFKVECVIDITGVSATRSSFYDTKTGIKVKELIVGEGIDSDGYYSKTRSEVSLVETNVDTDKDGLTDFEELFVTLTNPTEVDTNGNGVSDYNEDFDNDGLSNGVELSRGTKPWVCDSDGDLWGDSVDPMSNNAFVPNGVLIAIVVSVIVFIFYRLLRRKQAHMTTKKDSELGVVSD